MRESERRIRNNKIRRKRQLRQRCILGVFTLCMTLVLGCTFGGFFSKAQEKNTVMTYKYFESIQIESGDTLFDIAMEYAEFYQGSVQDYIAEVVAINHLAHADDITAGEYIVVPYYSAYLQ